jgi:hypothetical protein
MGDVMDQSFFAVDHFRLTQGLPVGVRHNHIVGHEITKRCPVSVRYGIQPPAAELSQLFCNSVILLLFQNA